MLKKFSNLGNSCANMCQSRQTGRPGKFSEFCDSLCLAALAAETLGLALLCLGDLSAVFVSAAPAWLVFNVGALFAGGGLAAQPIPPRLLI